MYSITDLKKGTVIQIDGVPFKVVDYAQKQMGRGGSIVNTKLKNLLDGGVVTKTFKGQERIEPAELTNRKVQYLYSDSDKLYFMDQKSFDQFDVPKMTAGESIRFLVEGSEVDLQLYDDKIISVELPTKLPLKVLETPSVVRGDTQSTVQKEATLENGTKIQVPIFINSSDTIIVDTRDGSYVERQK